MRPRFYPYFAVFISGLSTLGIELAAARLLGNVYGTSNLVWAAIIGLILLYLTIGSFLGGFWADRSPHWATFFTIMAWGAFTVGLIPLFSTPILRWAARGVLALNAPAAGGAFIATLLIFVIPITLLGCMSPFAIRLLVEDVENSGKISGRVSAISTMGALIGTFLPVLVLIPWLGTRLTYLFFALLLLGVALTGLLFVNRRKMLLHLWMLVVLLVLAFFSNRGSLKPVAGLLYEAESPYNLIQVVERQGIRFLLLNEGQGIHSIYAPQTNITNGTWDYFQIAPFFNAPPYHPDNVKSSAVVGLAAGTIPKQTTAIYGPIPIDGIDIDPKLAEVGRDWFEMNEPNLNVIVADGRWALANSENTYSMIAVDAYRLPYIPWHLTTVEFFQEAHDHLAEDGVLAINVGRTNTDRRLIEALGSTLLEVFPSVHVMDVPNSFNTIMVATVQPTDSENLVHNWAAMPEDANQELRTMMVNGVQALQPRPKPGIVFTDDKAPIEQMTNAIVFNFVLGDGMSMLFPAEEGS